MLKNFISRIFSGNPKEITTEDADAIKGSSNPIIGDTDQLADRLSDLIRVKVESLAKEKNITVTHEQLSGLDKTVRESIDKSINNRDENITQFPSYEQIKMVTNELVFMGGDKVSAIELAMNNGDFYTAKKEDAIKILEAEFQKLNLPIEENLESLVYDLIGMYNGAENEIRRQKYDLNKFFFMGSICEDSRPICIHIKNNYKGKISIEQLDKILDEFCPGGVPSEELITINTVNGNTRTVKKGEGMMKNTFIHNFSIKRGGSGCRHSVNWIT